MDRLDDCLRLLAEPRELPDTHKAIFYLLHHKHRHAITCTLVTPSRPAPPMSSPRFKIRLEEKPAVRLWQLLPGYDVQTVRCARVRGLAEADHIKATMPKATWANCISKIEHPLIRDTVGDVLRGWW